MCSINASLKRHFALRKHVERRIDRQNLSTDTARREQKTKAKKFKRCTSKPNRQHVTCSPRPPTLSQRHMNLHVWSYPWSSYIFQVSSKFVQRFRIPGESKFALSHYFSYWLLQQQYQPLCQIVLFPISKRNRRKRGGSDGRGYSAILRSPTRSFSCSV